jgi:CheY-like chemotaxis protein
MRGKLRVAKAAPGPLFSVHVLVVDDDEDSLNVMQTSLEYAGALVIAAATASDAFAALERFIPNVIVTDLRMPGEDGLSFARRLQLVPSLRAVPILAVTAYDEFYARRELHESGFVAFLRKPITYPDLVQAVSALAASPGSHPSQGAAAPSAAGEAGGQAVSM